jgi:hypothetical protein
MAKGRNKRPISPCVSMCGPPCRPGRSIRPTGCIQDPPAPDQLAFGAKSIFVVVIEHRSNMGQQRDVLILVMPIRTKGHSGGARGFVISESKIVGDCD